MSEELETGQSAKKTSPVLPPESNGRSPLVVTSSESAAREQSRAWSPSPARKEGGNAKESTSEFASSVHIYINDYIRQADQIAVFLFAAVGATLAFLNTRGVTKLWIKNPTAWSLNEVLAFLAVLGLLASATASLFAVLPRKKGSPTGLVSWRAISKCRSSGEYARLVLGSEPNDLTEAKLQ